MGRKPKSEKSNSIVVRLELRGFLKEKFDWLMKIYGTSTYKSLIEILITEKYEQMKEKII